MDLDCGDRRNEETIQARTRLCLDLVWVLACRLSYSNLAVFTSLFAPWSELMFDILALEPHACRSERYAQRHQLRPCLRATSLIAGELQAPHRAKVRG